jgi:recombinational DNA repair protein RecT
MSVMRLLLSGFAMILLPACATTSSGRDSCGAQLNAAWRELDLAKAEGFAGTVSYGKAVGLLTGAATQQAFEKYEGCVDKAKRARFYTAESRKGR